MIDIGTFGGPNSGTNDGGGGHQKIQDELISRRTTVKRITTLMLILFACLVLAQRVTHHFRSRSERWDIGGFLGS